MHFVFKYPDDRIQNCWTSHFKILAILSRVFNKRILFYKVSVNIIRILWLAVKNFDLGTSFYSSRKTVSQLIWQYIESHVISNELLSYIFWDIANFYECQSWPKIHNRNIYLFRASPCQRANCFFFLLQFTYALKLSSFFLFGGIVVQFVT